MEKVCKNISKKISQGGSMMIEAMAMLALIALVTPTLYKKSAERTTELQDINTATHVRTLTKALDNYVSANYQALLEGELKNADTYNLELVSGGNINEKIAPYLPYGYKFDELKNFGAPKVALKKQVNDNEIAITTFVQFPKKTDIGEMRSARIASMIGSNGGYVDGDHAAKGVGGVWELDSTGLSGLGFDTNKGSVVVASSEAINSATSGALENEKYLQRTKVESESQKWRNTMSTDLYMGGTQNAEGSGMSDMHKILGVEQLIVGATTSDKNYDLVLSEDGSKGGSAYLAGNFSALSDTFTVSGDVTNAELVFGDSIYANTGTGEVSFNNGDVVLNDTAEIALDTNIAGKLNVNGDTTVAIDAGTRFQAGNSGAYIDASGSEVSLLGGLVKTVNGANSLTSINTNLEVSGTSNLKDNVKIGTGEATPAQVLNPILNVQGDAFVSGTLEVGDKIITTELDLLNLHAGGTDLGSDKRWLHATGEGVIITDINTSKDRLVINNGKTALYSAKGTQDAGGKVEFGDTNAILQGSETVEIYSYEPDGSVVLQDKALVLTGKPGTTDENKVNINATKTSINSSIFEIANPSASATNPDNLDNKFFTVNTTTNETNILTESTKISSEKLDISGNPLLQVQPKGYSDSSRSVVGIDNKQFVVTAGLTYGADGTASWNANPVEVLRVNTYDMSPKTSEQRDTIEGGSQPSVYIRRGAIELEKPTEISQTAADAGIGYIEASRFVSNAIGSNNNVATPVYAGDYAGSSSSVFGGVKQKSVYYDGEKINPDRYMVNPAYTSVMHDIKLTTRGGARLSDILPDFINKGIYVVSNTYQDVLDVENMTGTVRDGQVGVIEAPDSLDITGKDLSGTNQWASPFLGVVPAPQCPPGHARVITITPAGFMMANTGDILHTEAKNPYGNSKTKRFVLSFTAGANMNMLKDNALVAGLDDNETILKPTYEAIGDGASATKYALAYTDISKGTLEPIYFQQSTWLKSKVIKQANGCTNVKGEYGTGGNCTDGNFIGWSAIMGFLYHTNQYGDFIKYVTGKTEAGYYWNIFPVMTTSLEAYATVYCYFDRSNIYGSGNDATYVDQYDQLNNFRGGYKKEDDNNIDYIGRLNDPTLEYNNPW